jgi:hypothetical protein
VLEEADINIASLVVVSANSTPEDEDDRDARHIVHPIGNNLRDGLEVWGDR